MVGLVVYGGSLVTIPVPKAEYEDCLQSAKKYETSETSCQLHESVLTRTFKDPTLYYAGWVAIFTAILAVVGLGQGVLIAEQISLGRKEFIFGHRPRLIVQGFHLSRELCAGENPVFVFTAINIGDSAAHIIEIQSFTMVGYHNDGLSTNMTFPYRETINYTLRSGQRELVPGNGGSKISYIELEELRAGQKELVCLGIVTYLDDADTRRQTGFCRRYRVREGFGEWETWEDDEYEYAY
jgi:hypothetical protein